MKWKYQLTVDGDTCAWVRFLYQMLSGSVPLKVETSKIEWFYKDIQPWVHYVPVKEDFSDLLENIEWLK